jgi:TatD DNase family protein
MGMIDTHAHLADESLASQLDDVLERASKAGVSQMICVAVDARTASKAIAIAESKHSVWASVGIHPNYAHEAAAEHWPRIIEYTNHPRVCALGETGLDLHWDDCPFEIQQANFDRHWDLSRITELPLIIHMRDCESEMLSALDKQAKMKSPLRGVMHSFAGSKETAQQCLAYGLYISFAGMLTYKKSDELRKTAMTIPLDRILIETDCPYLTPEPNRSRRPNEPAFVAHTAKCLAETIGVSVKKLTEITSENAKRLFWKMAGE